MDYPEQCSPAYKTEMGSMFYGRAEQWLASEWGDDLRGKVQLVFTSPPFPLNRKKRYGNLEGQEYVRWLSGFAESLRDLLTPDGSIVLELGNAWVPGSPTTSTLPIESLLAFKSSAALHLCQEFVCFNPARLPSPAQWVTIERIRVKDAFTRVWWMSPSERPKADNEAVLTEYSAAMQRLLKRGTYNSGRRPSDHDVSDSGFLKDHGGAIPPNVLVTPQGDSEGMGQGSLPVLPIANTRSTDAYQQYCRESGIERHPARMPTALAEFFIQFLSEEGDLVFDPFGGSNTTGASAQQLSRRWASVEPKLEYVAGSAARFEAVDWTDALSSAIQPRPDAHEVSDLTTAIR